MKDLQLKRVKTKAKNLKEIRVHSLPPEKEHITEKRDDFFKKFIDYWKIKFSNYIRD
jgi:hypothetical protein